MQRRIISGLFQDILWSVADNVPRMSQTDDPAAGFRADGEASDDPPAILAPPARQLPGPTDP